MHALLFYSEEDINIIESSLYFLNAVSTEVPKEHDEVSFVKNVIKLVLYALSRKSFSQTIRSKVISNLEKFLLRISHRIFQSREFSVNIQPMQNEIKV